ncbi:MAG: AfsR/SARP family transcriptional regulator [Streptomycetaceae bacterium]|nr:AfsR/SARP family transcriptional regulator [Streptomycetaceae bacterium]
MRYGILGDIRVTFDDGAGAGISARKVELLLAVLLVRADQVVSSPQLEYEIWGDNPPRRSTAALHVYVSQLRKFLASHGSPRPGGPRIVTRPPGYMLNLGTDVLDVREFQIRMRQSRSHARAGRLEDAADYARDALGLWRGPVLGDLRGGPIVDEFAAWAEEARLECTEAQIEADLALGRHRELVPALRTLVAEHPMREAFARQLMLALYRAERQSDALQAYQEVRHTLRRELGVEPGRALQRLQQAILVGDGTLDLRPVA